MSIHSILQLLVMVEECRTSEQVIAELESLLKVYRFDYYALLRRLHPCDGPAGLMLAGRWPEGWLDIFISKKYMLIDPTIRYLGRAHRGFRWRDAVAAYRADPHRKRMERMMGDAKAFGLEDGYTLPVHGRSGLLGNLTVGGRPIDLSPVELSMFDAVAKKVFWRLIELGGQAEKMERIPIADTQMTRREMEVLTFLADGMTSNEISRILQISNHTVDWYMNGIQDKLNAKNRQHVVAIAFRLGLIS